MGEEKTAKQHWSQQKEQGSGYWHFKFLLFLFRIFPVVVLRIIAFPVGFFYFIFSKKARTESKRFLKKAALHINDPKTAQKCLSVFGPLRHIVSFSLALVEKLQSWGGKYPHKNIHFQNDDSGEFIRLLENGNGAFIITSHLGNTDLLRAIASFSLKGVSRKVSITAIVDIKVTKNFNRMIKEINQQSDFDLLHPSEIGPQTAVLLEEKIASGGIVTVAGDRTSVNSGGKNTGIPFLGEEAPFPLGIFYLASLLKAPVYFIFALRKSALSIRPDYNMHVHKSDISFECNRKERLAQSSVLARSFAELLENYCKEQPFQWYNYFDFWAKGV
jgi:predicted LPLAT superfamily acyltransferase